MASAAVQSIVIMPSPVRSDEACEIVTAGGHAGIVAWRGIASAQGTQGKEVCESACLCIVECKQTFQAGRALRPFFLHQCRRLHVDFVLVMKLVSCHLIMSFRVHLY